MKTKYCFILILAAFLNSCAPIYIPNNINTPLLSKKNEATINLGFGQNGVDCQLSYAVSENIGLLLNGSYLSDESNSNFNKDITYQEHQKYIEAAIGSFGELSKNIVLEAYFGGGYGNSSSVNTYLLSDSKKIYGEGDYYKLFLQTDMEIKLKFLEGGVALRTAYIKFDKLKYEVDFPVRSLDGIFMEPALFMRIGGPIFKIQTQVGFSSKLSSRDFLIYDPLILSIGVMLRINAHF